MCIVRGIVTLLSDKSGIWTHRTLVRDLIDLEFYSLGSATIIFDQHPLICSCDTENNVKTLYLTNSIEHH